MNKILNSAIAVAVTTLAACAPPQTSNDIQRDTQEKMVREGVSQVGVPSIKNFRELKIAKDIYEMRDQEGLVTYTYTFSEQTGRYRFFCDSIGYPLPYSTQFSQPTSVQRYNLPSTGSGEGRAYGTEVLPQAEPNGLFSPASAEGSWILCKDPNGRDVHPTYSEPRLIVSQFRLPGAEQ